MIDTSHAEQQFLISRERPVFFGGKRFGLVAYYAQFGHFLKYNVTYHVRRFGDIANSLVSDDLRLKLAGRAVDLINKS